MMKTDDVTTAASVQVLTNTMKPDLERLEGEKVQFLEWQKACSTAEKLSHLVEAHEYWQLLQQQEGDAEYLERLAEEMQHVEEQIQDFQVRPESLVTACSEKQRVVDLHCAPCICHPSQESGEWSRAEGRG